MTNPEAEVAEIFGLEEDPLEKFNDGMQSSDTDWFEYHYENYIAQRDLTEETKRQYERSYRDWCEFMQEYDRHPTVPTETHVETFIDQCLERMEGGACRKKINRIEGVYEWMQENPRLPHPTNYNPFLLVKNKRQDDLESTDPEDYPQLDIDDIRAQVKSIKHIGERAATVMQLKTGVRSSELCNIRMEEIHLTNPEVLSHYDGTGGQDHGPMGSHSSLDEISNAVYIPPEDKRSGNKRKVPTIIPIDDETRRVLIDWLLIRPDNGDPHLFLSQKGKPLERNSLRHIWTKHWHPEYEFSSEDEFRSISPHYARHWFTSWFRTEIRMPEVGVQYLRGDKTGPEIGTSRSAIHRYIHPRYDDIEEEYRREIFQLGI